MGTFTLAGKLTLPNGQPATRAQFTVSLVAPASVGEREHVLGTVTIATDETGSYSQILSTGEPGSVYRAVFESVVSRGVKPPPFGTFDFPAPKATC